MDKLLAHNIHWKIISFLIASLLWLFVINTQNPMQPLDIKDIPLEIIGLAQIEEKGFSILNIEDLLNLDIDAKVQGQRLDLDYLVANRSSLINASINLTPYATDLNPNTGTSERSVPITLEFAVDGIVIEDYSPKSMYVTFETEDNRIYPIDYQIQGKEDSQYMTLDPVIKVTEVEISGPESAMERISWVIVDINVDEFSEDTLNYTLPVIALDEHGFEIDGLTKTPENVEVILPIGKKKVVPLEAQFTGSLPSGYIHTNTIVTPSEITIVGKEEIIDNIHSIPLNAISLNTLVTNTTKQVDFIMPDGVEYLDRIESNAVVTIEIKQINTYDFVIDTADLNFNIIGLGSNLKYSITQPTIIVQLGGVAETLLLFDTEHMLVDLNLTGLEVG
ncbi:MAG: hypothetical protein BEN19_01130, partial [Epulopiscium sp. Nuni2H_MBin003]